MGEVLEQVVQAAADIVPGADLVSITLRDGSGKFHTPVATDPLAERLDQLQYETGQGPCWEAARVPGPAVCASDDLATGRRWPEFAAVAAREGMRTVLSTALLADAEPTAQTGALNIYSRQRDGLDDDQRHVALLLATHASLALAHTRAVEIAELRETNLRRALDSRDVIGQAKGILMARQDVTPEQAFDILRATSQRLNVKLATLAETLTRRHGEL